jgi:putative copper export protein
VLSQVLSQLAAVDPNPLPPLWRFLTRFTYLVGLIGTLGGGLLYLLVLRPVLARESVATSDRDVLRRRAALTLAATGTWFLSTLYFQYAAIVARSQRIPYSEAVPPGRVLAHATTPVEPGEWLSAGARTGLQLALLGVAAVVLMLLWAPRLQRRITGIVTAAYVVAIAGHAVPMVPTDPSAETLDSVLNTTLDQGHVLAVSTWVGGIATLAVLATAHRRLTPGAGAVWAQIWSRFSIVALIAVGGMVITGSWLAWKNVGGGGDLVATEHGRLLLLKLSLVTTMVVLGAVNEFVLMPRIAKARAAGQEASVFRLAVRVFPRLVAAEAVLGLGALLVLMFLTGSARAESGSEEPVVDGGVITVGLVLIAAVTISLVATTKVSGRLSRPGEASAAVPTTDLAKS